MLKINISIRSIQYPRSYILRCLKSVIRHVHYLTDANPIRQPKDLVNCLMSNMVIHDDQVVVFNKPPGLMVLGRNFSYERNAFILVV